MKFSIWRPLFAGLCCLLLAGGVSAEGFKFSCKHKGSYTKTVKGVKVGFSLNYRVHSRKGVWKSVGVKYSFINQAKKYQQAEVKLAFVDPSGKPIPAPKGQTFKITLIPGQRHFTRNHSYNFSKKIDMNGSLHSVIASINVTDPPRARVNTKTPEEAAKSFFKALDNKQDSALWKLVTPTTHTALGKLFAPAGVSPKTHEKNIATKPMDMAGCWESVRQSLGLGKYSAMKFSLKSKDSKKAVVNLVTKKGQIQLQMFKTSQGWTFGLQESFKLGG